MATNDPERALSDTADELEERTEKLGEHIDEARHKLEELERENARLEDAEDVAGDWRDADDDQGGDDPKGAAE